MGSTASDAPAPAPGPVSLRGLFVAAAQFVRDLGHDDLEQDGLSVLCIHGGVQVQVLRAAADIEDRRAVVADAASILHGTARVQEHIGDGPAPAEWGIYGTHGRFMEAPVWLWTPVSPGEATRMGWSNVVELPLDGCPR
jgi:hypothetical protein